MSRSSVWRKPRQPKARSHKRPRPKSSNNSNSNQKHEAAEQPEEQPQPEVAAEPEEAQQMQADDHQPETTDQAVEGVETAAEPLRIEPASHRAPSRRPELKEHSRSPKKGYMFAQNPRRSRFEPKLNCQTNV